MLKFRGTYRGKNHTFTFEEIFGSKTGIPSIDVYGQLISIHRLENLVQYSTFKDKDGVELYASDMVIASDSQDKGTVNGIIVFDKGCFSIHITQVSDGYILFDIGQKPPMYEFTKFTLVKEELKSQASK